MNTTAPARRRRPAGQREYPVTAVLEGAFEDGRSEVESLKEEMGDWKDSLESNSMEHLPKYEEVSECADCLEAALDILEMIEAPSPLSDGAANYTRDTRQSAGSRSGRLGNAQNALEAAKSAAEGWLDDNPELTVVERDEEDEDNEGTLGEDETYDQADADQRDSDRSEAETFVEQLQEALDELDNVSFPGMY